MNSVPKATAMMFMRRDEKLSSMATRTVRRAEIAALQSR
jgi:hypothetical protein